MLLAHAAVIRVVVCIQGAALTRGDTVVHAVKPHTHADQHGGNRKGIEEGR